jgi:hypothetical protein
MKKNSKRKVVVCLLFFLLSACSQNKSESEITEQFVESPSTTMSIESPSTTTSDVESVTSTTTIDLENIEGVEYLVITSREHTEEDLDYPTVPPAGGDHLGIWHNCGKYIVELLDEAAVHSLEHGVVWITYLPELPLSEIQKLDNILEGNQRFLMSPYSNQPAPIVLTSWGRRLEIEEADDPRIIAFIEAFTDSSSSPEPGVTCNGGLGIPPGDPFTPHRGSGTDQMNDGSIEIGIRSQSISTSSSNVT